MKINASKQRVFQKNTESLIIYAELCNNLPVVAWAITLMVLEGFNFRKSLRKFPRILIPKCLISNSGKRLFLIRFLNGLQNW